MSPQIAILAWGSLLWHGRPEFEKWHDVWRFDGPILKLEFSRVSESRLRALTLVIDELHGADTCVAWCLSRRREICDAVADLRCREGTTMANIGCWMASATSKSSVPTTIIEWAHAHRLDAVVWTKLASNFESEVKRPFSVEEAVAHVRRLPPEGKVKATEYVSRAPDFIRTPVRAALECEPWFVSDGGA